jgi:hypothetical protein
MHCKIKYSGVYYQLERETEREREREKREKRERERERNTGMKGLVCHILTGRMSLELTCSRKHQKRHTNLKEVEGRGWGRERADLQTALKLLLLGAPKCASFTRRWRVCNKN